MKLISDAGNIHTLKIAIASELTGTHLQYEEVKHDEKVAGALTQNKLPILEVDTGLTLFSANAACRYILCKAGQDVDSLMVDQWLEWEAAELQPVLWPYLVSSVGQGKVESKQVQAVKGLLAHLDDALHLKELIVRDQISAADIVLWSALFPAFFDIAALQDWSSQYLNISRWFNKLSQHPAFQKGFTMVTSGKGVSAFKASLLAQPVPLPAIWDTKKLKMTLTGSGDKEKTEPPSEEKSVSVTAEETKAAVAAWKQMTTPTPVQRTHPILPQEGKRNILITSALPYVNNVPHLGNIIGCVLSADVYARFCRLRNYNILYISGTDEYGTATETKALEEGLTPQQICDKYNKLHSEIYEWFNIDFDYFGRTSTTQQTEISQDIFWKLYEKGFVITDTVEQLHCAKCDRFLADRFVEGTCPLCAYEDARGDQCDKCGKLINATELKNPKCKVCKTTPEIKTSEHLFLDLPKLEPTLSSYLDKQFEDGIWTQNAKVITKSWIRDGLKPRCITRDLKWGTPVPLEGFTDKVFYVWFDAPIGYISIMANYTDKWKQWWKNPQQVQLYNFMAKDNVPFHSVIFPCTLLGADDNFTIVNHLSACEYLNYEDGKFSKSRGIGVFGNNAQETGVPADIWRFYLLFIRPESQDSTFAWEDFVLKNNSELLNNLGNFINRALMFVANSFGGQVQEITLTSEDEELLALITRDLKAYVDCLEKIKLREGITHILNISRLGNQYMQANKPWELVKGDAAQKSRAGTVVSLSANIACLLSVLLQPYMPQVSATIQMQVNAPKECNVITEKFVCLLKPGHKIGTPQPLFKKMDPKEAEAHKKKFAGQGDDSKKATSGGKGKGPAAAVAANPAEAERLTAEVAKQGDAVRQLKASKADKTTIDAAVAVLLDLKKQLSAAQGQNSHGHSNTADPAAAERLTAEVTKQGDVVRQLKASKADKSSIDEAVAVLLDLKKQLALAQGQNPTDVQGSGKKKGKKK
ncbi:methionine--tRNA ligase, cytoplasmic [Lingula anatina]|uniref:Methionine--tRNA ligase, cytoplasmic n=1 Tax=Lingula anatina TaxID=7574 RepID=A0A1S3HGY8_LINAN|nr:methionine--tRNA ligase, cytoplasmic [Lingula anatina]|eukprot:XP_013384289.1 methionine--tRNA ligase, cytoplasmic [Lingula anatina]